jgi:hypothetical protein
LLKAWTNRHKAPITSAWQQELVNSSHCGFGYTVPARNMLHHIPQPRAEGFRLLENHCFLVVTELSARILSVRFPKLVALYKPSHEIFKCLQKIRQGPFDHELRVDEIQAEVVG